ncbi:MAG TPA: hypothetical protein PKE26_02390 [Kiritimatiellia bacterium]|nr:hypothetical protein [Kiritimatiellia bacterium]HMO97937.1 hypothetical protein [Kiritimatiellia bacterium]
MKILPLALMACWVIAVETGYGQPERNRPQDNGNRERPGRLERGDQRASPPLYRWMQDLRTSDPELFARLQALRRENPPAFREEARRMAYEKIQDTLRRERPAVFNALAGLSEDDRNWMVERLVAWSGGMRPKPAHHAPDVVPRDDKRPERAPDLVRRHRLASDMEERARIREQLRDMLAQQYDEHWQTRREQLAEMEEKLAAMRRALEEGQEGRDRMIEDALSTLLDGAIP